MQPIIPAGTKPLTSHDNSDDSISSKTAKRAAQVKLAKEGAVSESKKMKAHDPVQYKNKKFTCLMTITSQDEEHVYGYGTITANRRDLDVSYEGGVKVGLASTRILRHGVGKVSVSELCSYRAEFLENEEIKRI